MTDPIESSKVKSTEQLWDEIGFHKPMAGFWYKIIYQFIGLGISATLMGYLISFFYRYEKSGHR